jgi:Ser/Thr protein kinase RdoA (MazF antagonist)
MKPGNLPLEAWSSTLARAHVDQLEHSNPEVLLWSIKAADHRQYVLRSAGPWRPGADLADEHRVLLHLSRNGVSVALPVRTDSGALFVTNCERTYVLAPRLATQAVNHESHPDAADICSRIGTALGDLHLALASYPSPVESYQHDLLVHAFEESYPKLPVDVRERSIDPHADEAKSVLRGLPTQLIHGDCNSGNVLVSNGQVSGFIDFDHLPVGQRLYDLAYYLVHRRRELVADDTSFLAAVASYVAGYHRSNPLSDAERAALPAAMLAAEISLTSWSHVLLTDLPHRAGPTESDKYARGITSLSWISSHFTQLTEAASPEGGDGRTRARR